MPSVLHFSPAFNFNRSLADFPSSPQGSFKKRKRGLDPFHSCGGHCGVEKTNLPSEYFSAGANKPSAALSVDALHSDNSIYSPTSSHLEHERSHATRSPRPFPHQMANTALSMSKGRISNELATLRPPLYVANGSVPIAKAENTSSSIGLGQRHLNTITTILHKCLSDGDYIRAGRAWAMLLRAEQNGHSIDLRTHDRWGVGAEIFMQRESQTARKNLDHRVVEISSSTSSLRVMAKSVGMAREHYERAVLQYPYRKAFPNATGPLNFYIAMFSIWIYTVKEQGSIALMAVGSSNKDINETDTDANDDVQRSSASHMDADRYRKREQIKSDTLKDAHEIATRLDGLLVSPPFSDNARFWKLCGEVSLWIADLLATAISSKYGSSTSGDEEDITVGSSSLLSIVSRSTPSDDEHRVRQERQKALAKAKEAFQRVNICGGTAE